MTGVYELTTEVFSLPSGENHLVYAPLRQTTVLLNGAALNVLVDVAGGRAVATSGGEHEVLALLIDLGLIQERAGPGTATAHECGCGAHGCAPKGDALRPTNCTLFLTTACNLRCLYCYASGGERPRSLSSEIALRAIDAVVANAMGTEAATVGVTFHGGGEPTRASATLKRCVAHARRRARDEELKLTLGVATNGVMSDAMRAYLADNMDSVTISVDGPPAVQDRLRPTADGGPSSPAVERTLRRLAGADCSVGARLTCTDESIDSAFETVRYLVDEHRLSHVHLEPLFVCGRSTTHGLRPPDPQSFIEAFRRCRDYAWGRGVKVAYSGARQSSLTRSFCQVSSPSFNVTSDGDVTACYEVVDRADPRAETFIYGSYDRGSGSFVFDQSRIERLRRLTVADAPRCARCFAKYHCAGGCPAKRLYPGAEDAVVARCEINRRLTLDQLEGQLAESDRVGVA
jgi:uncharacterized protein